MNLSIFILYWLEEAHFMYFVKEFDSSFIVHKYVAENLSSDVSASSES